MFDRNWGNGLATGLIVGGGLVVLVFVFWYGPECSPDYPCSYPHQNEPQNGSIWYDTAAQWLAAITGVFVVLFTFWTVLLVRQALAADDAALDQAKLQTGHAERSAEAAFRSVDITREMGRAQTRAYVSAAWAVAEDRGIYSIVGVNFINTGQTPALSINIYAGQHVFPQSMPPLYMTDNAVGRDFGPLEAGGNITLPPCRKGVEQDILTVKEANGSITLRVYGRVQYETVFHEAYETEFVFETNVISMEFAQDPIKMKRSERRSRTYRLINPDTQAK